MSQKVITANACRLSYPALFQPKAPQNGQGEPKYSATLLIPKTDTATVKQITDAIQNEINAAASAAGAWKGKAPANPTLTFYDGDTPNPSSGEDWGDECKGCYVLRTSAKNKPDVVDENGQKALDATKFYAGCWCYFSINFAAWENTGKKGVGAFLNCVMFDRDGEPLDGHASAADDFAAQIAAHKKNAPAAAAVGWTVPAAQ
jgi:hypothetical protein